MPPESVVLLLVGTWLLVAAAMLWGMLRIARRHQRPAPVSKPRFAVSTHLLAKQPAKRSGVSRVRQQAGSYRT